jgi:hypothetical protein
MEEKRGEEIGGWLFWSVTEVNIRINASEG